MPKLSHRTLIIISGLVWLGVGCFLMVLGIRFLNETTHAWTFSPSSFPLLGFFASYVGGLEEGAMVLIVMSLLIGFLKGKYVLGKSARQGVMRILEMPNPSPLKDIYSKKYYILLALMIGLGMSMKYLGLSTDVRGFVDVAIGSALINGAMCYFRMAFTKKTA
jgi:hypothetical protein